MFNPEEPDIHIGAWYEFFKQTPGGVSYTVRLRAVKKYTRHVLFETENKYRESIDYWTIARTIK